MSTVDSEYSGPILFLCGCQKYREYLDAAMRRMQSPAWRTVGVVGGGTGSSVYDAATQILSLAVPDTYEALPTKVHAAFSWIHKQFPNASGVFKTDDDMIFPNLKMLAFAIDRSKELPYWGGTVSHCQEASVNPMRIELRFDDKSLRPRHQTAFYCFGNAGYWISKAALPLIVAAEEDYKASYLEDVCTGFVMNRAGILPKRILVPCKEVPRGPELLRA